MTPREPNLREQIASLGQFTDRTNTSITPLAVKTQPWKSKSTGYGGTQHIYRFPNGYGASVVQGIGTYGADDGLWELGVLRFDGDKHHLTYDTPITSDVIGWLTPEDVAALLDRIEALS